MTRSLSIFGSGNAWVFGVERADPREIARSVRLTKILRVPRSIV
jgi:hypothetical protein